MRSSKPMSYMSVFRKSPDAVAFINGSEKYKDTKGVVRFYQLNTGVIVIADIIGLPESAGECTDSFFGFHIHEGESCSGDENDPFADALSHFNPLSSPHPCHAGDFPPLLSAQGRAFSAFLTGRFTVCDVIGRAVIIHSAPDDFTTQPSGNAKEKIACGTIKSVKLR